MILKLLITVTVVKSCTGELYEKEVIHSVNEIKNFQVFGDSLIILSKNETKFEDETSDDDFDEYLNSHLIRIKLPLYKDEYYDFDMKDLTVGNENEARSHHQSLKKILIPILLALIIKSTILLPIFAVFVALIAAKGFWAGMTALLLSKAIALKVFYQAQEEHDHDHEDHDEYEDHEEYHEHHDHHDHSFHHSPPSRLPSSHETSHHGPREYGYPVYEKRAKFRQAKANFGNRHEETSDVNNYYGSEAWRSWGRDQPELERQKWENSSPDWGVRYLMERQNLITIEIP